MALPLASQTVILNDGTIATIHPVWNGSQLPLELVAALCVEYNAEIDRGRSFPETQRMMLENFEKTWFSGVSGVMIKGDDSSQNLLEDFDLLDNSECLGSFWIQPCFPGRSSHICTANLLVKSKYRNHGVGKAMCQCFLRWALQLGYDYALFTLVYDCNIAACKILDKLGFRVLNVLKGAGILKGFDHPVDAFIFGRSLIGHGGLISTPVAGQTPGPTPGLTPIGHTPDIPSSLNSEMTPGVPSGYSMGLTPTGRQNNGPSYPPTSSEVSSGILPSSNTNNKTGTDTTSVNTESVPSSVSTVYREVPLSTEFQHIRTYLTSGVYPSDANRTERTRIRSRARSYEVQNGILVFKRTQTPVVADENEQMRIATEMHRENHNGINKLQKRILESYHWHGVRDTLVKVIRSCPECRAANSRSQQTNDEDLSDIDVALRYDTPVVHQAQTPISSQPDIQRSIRPPIQAPIQVQQSQPGFAPNSHFHPQIQAQHQPTSAHSTAEFGLPDSLDADIFSTSSYFPETQDPYSSNIVYLPPENEDDEYVPEDADLDLGLGQPNEADEDVDDDDSLFRDEDDDDEWTGEYQDDEDEDEDEDEVDDEDEDETPMF